MNKKTVGRVLVIGTLVIDILWVIMLLNGTVQQLIATKHPIENLVAVFATIALNVTSLMHLRETQRSNQVET
jgi:Na+/pantothenate symporter